MPQRKVFKQKNESHSLRRVFAKREKCAEEIKMGSALSSFKEQRKEKKELKRYLDHLLLV